MRITSLVLFVAAAVLAIILACDIGIRPTSWSSIRLGETVSSVESKYPDLGGKVINSNGGCGYSLIEPRVIGHWVTFYDFDRTGRLTSKNSEFQIGNQNFALRLRHSSEH
jgi:hypothetical protein